jgi:hypothetical protein
MEFNKIIAVYTENNKKLSKARNKYKYKTKIYWLLKQIGNTVTIVL